MPQLFAVQYRTTEDLISLRIFEGIPVFGAGSDPKFTYWAGVEVSEPQDGLQTLEIPKGTYAIFNYQGKSSDSTIWRFIYGKWIPHSDWELDDRPHFERLGSNYKNDDHESEEEIWIPVRPRE